MDHYTLPSKRSFESDTWLILGITIAVFAFLSSLGIFVLCYRRRGHKRRMDKKRLSAAKASRGNYVRLDEEKGVTGGETEETVPLGQRRTAESESPRITPPPPTERLSRSRIQPQSQPSLLSISAPPLGPDGRRRDSSPQPYPLPQRQPSPQRSVVNVNLQHPQPQGVYLPPVVSNDRGQRQSLRAEYDHKIEHDHGHDYYHDDFDGRTGQRFERDRSPSPDLDGAPDLRSERLVLTRSISMLRPREQV